MNVVFAKPPVGGILGLEMITFVEPLGLSCIAGGLEEDGHRVEILDLRIEGHEVGLAKLRERSPGMVGLQCNFTTERFRTLRLAQAIRAMLPETFILVGGHDASRDPEWFEHSSIDAVAVGDGERIATGVANALEGKGSLEDVLGLRLHRNGRTIDTGEENRREPLDELPMPARHLTSHYAPNYYVNFEKPLALLETARGCPYRCNFCSVWNFHDKSFREKSPERVVAELRQIECDSVFVVDDIFWLNAERGLEMARQIRDAGITKKFRVQTRSDVICRNPEVIEAWKELGDLSIFLGLEKIDNAGLASVNKHNEAENNMKALGILRDLGVGYTPNFIVDPDWDRADFAKLRRWVEEEGAFNSGFSVLTPLPGTDLWASVRDQVNTRDWELFDIMHAVLPTKLDQESFYEEYASLWRTVLEVRYRERGRFRSYFKMGAALATGKVSLGAIQKGMNMAKVLGRKETFLKAHAESEQRLEQAGVSVP